MHNDLLIGIALVLGLGTIAQWVAWRIKLPSIIFLLLIGLAVGPISAITLGTPILDVEHLLGELFFPVVSVSVAVILFEGGLSLRFSDIRGRGGVVGKLVSIGALMTWLISGVGVYFLFDVSVGLALLIGATLVVTGPTVVIPLLKQIRPTGRVASLLNSKKPCRFFYISSLFIIRAARMRPEDLMAIGCPTLGNAGRWCE